MNEILVVKIPVKKKGESVHMKKVVAMYEQEEAYGKNLAEYVNRKENMPFELQVFSQADKLSDYLQGHTPVSYTHLYLTKKHRLNTCQQPR